jgi:hypothetical protein
MGILRRPWGGLLAVSAAMLTVAFIAWVCWPHSTPEPTHAPETIAPGTVVGQVAPEGWTHLIIKSLPRVRPGEESKIPLLTRGQSVRMAAWMFTVFAADVRLEHKGGKTHYQLLRVGMGLGTNRGGRDIVITPETAAEHGVELNLITREILTRGYNTLRLAVVVIHGPTFALVDAPVWYHCDGKNRLIRFRYALVVDAPTGRLDTAVWLLDSEGQCADETVAIMAPDTIDPAELVPDPNEFNAIGIPSDGAFAVDGLPPARARVLLPPDLQSLAAQGKYTAAEAGRLEKQIRQLLKDRQ